jgi:hypothetical protein
MRLGIEGKVDRKHACMNENMSGNMYTKTAGTAHAGKRQKAMMTLDM